MKFATYVSVFDQDKWILRNLENSYPHVDKIYVLYSKLPWNYNPKARDTYVNEFDLNIIKNSPYMDKIEIIEGDWLSDTDQRNSCLKKAKEDNIDYLMAHDADEFYFHNDFEKIKWAIRNNPQYDSYEIDFYAFWKSFKYILIDPKKGKKSGRAQTIVNVKNVDKYCYIRNVESNNRAFINDVVCYHGSYVLTDEQVFKKIKTWSHGADFDVDKWYNEVWLTWTPDSRNLHPIWPEAWTLAEEFKGILPEVISDLGIKRNINEGYNFIFKGVYVGQNPGIKEIFPEILKDFDRIIEIGTHAGGLTLFLHENKRKNCELISYDINTDFNKVPKKYNIDFRKGDCFDKKILSEIKNLILEKTKKILLLCDGGDKNKEFNIFSEYLKPGDVIMLHDYAESKEEFKRYQEILKWPAPYESSYSEIKDSLNLYKLKKHRLYEDFKKVIWGIFEKEEIFTELFLSKEKYLSFTEKHKVEAHWSTAKQRWAYHEKAIKLLKGISNIENRKILEAGTMGTNICTFSDTIDIDLPDSGWPLYYNVTYLHNLKQLPWPIKDKQYDVFIALRVFHHLLDKPEEYFKEMKRIANHIILAFPDPIAKIYRNISKPLYDIKYPPINTTILYYNFENKDILFQNESATIKKINNLIYKTIDYVPNRSLNKELFEREVYWLKKLEKYDIAPKIIELDKEKNTIVMTNCGNPINSEQLKLPDIQMQLLNILKIFMQNNCFYNDFDVKNTLILNNKIRIIDFSWCPLIKEDYTCESNIDSKLKNKPWGNFYTLFNYI